MQFLEAEERNPHGCEVHLDPETFHKNRHSNAVTLDFALTHRYTMRLLTETYGDDDGSLPQGWMNTYPETFATFFADVATLPQCIKNELNIVDEPMI